MVVHVLRGYAFVNAPQFDNNMIMVNTRMQGKGTGKKSKNKKAKSVDPPPPSKYSSCQRLSERHSKEHINACD